MSKASEAALVSAWKWGHITLAQLCYRTGRTPAHYLGRK